MNLSMNFSTLASFCCIFPPIFLIWESFRSSPDDRQKDINTFTIITDGNWEERELNPLLWKKTTLRLPRISFTGTSHRMSSFSTCSGLIGKKNSLFTTCRGRVISYYSSSSAIRNPWLKDTAFTRFFLNCGSCFFDRHLHSHCCLCPKFLSPHAFGAFLHPVLTCLAIPLYIQLRQAVPSSRRPSYLILTAAF